MPGSTYDYAIIGAGAAGLQLALAMAEDPWFDDKEILILDREEKKDNDKTWCYWEVGEGRWDKLVHHHWDTARFITHRNDLDLKLSPYRYKMLKSVDFYDYGREVLSQKSNFHWKQEDVLELIDQDPVAIGLVDSSIDAHHVFDSQVDEGYFERKGDYIHLLQHFKGWFIETSESIFKPNEFTMMDYRPRWKDTTSFMYLLPFSENQALIEFTFFSPEMVEDEVYEDTMDTYLKDMLGIKNYQVHSVEQGVIPMTTYPFHESSSRNITKIGTAGSWVKGSSGYSFHNCGKKVNQLIENLKSGKLPDQGLIHKKFRYYDLLFLDVLYRKNEKGEALFETMYTKNSIHKIFRFLDEESSFSEDLSIMSSFKPGPFIGSIIRNLF